ncbi:MAG: NifU family protein [Candidatus Methanomethylicia archaeon]
MREKVMDILNAIKPFLEVYRNGYSEIDISENGDVKVVLKNPCPICKQLITQLLKEKIPEVREIIVS